MAKPFIKWVGGKRQLWGQMLPLFPFSDPLRLATWKGTYFEPFLGGGAVFFALEELGLQQAVLNDYNAELINLYQIVQQNALLLHQTIQASPFLKFDSSAFQSIRAWDRDPQWPQSKTKVERAARFIYLNRTAFNGLWRVNQSNQFNTPFGKYKSQGIPPFLVLKEAQQALQKVSFLQGDFAGVLNQAKAGDLVYLDPPYVPISATSSFASYTEQGFDPTMQQRLADLCETLTQKNVAWALSNSDCEYTRTLYNSLTQATIHTVQASRSINHQATGRGKINELLVVGPHQSF